MWKFKFGLWAVVLITSVFSFSACKGGKTKRVNMWSV